MTSIVGWVNKEKKNKPSIWIAGDTKISGTQGTLTLEGSKIMDIPLHVKNISSLEHEVYYKSSIGFAFAGSSLVAHNVYNSLKYFLSNIGGVMSKNQLPSFEQIAIKAQGLLGFYVKNIQSQCEFFLSGKCPIIQELQLYKICVEKNADDVFEPQCYRLDTQSANFYLLGDKQKEMKEDIIQMVNDLTSNKIRHHTRAPLYALRKVIRQKKYESIGGGIQLGITYELPYGHFELYPVWEKNEKGEIDYFHNNIAVFEEIGKNIGDCLIGIKGLQIENYDE